MPVTVSIPWSAYRDQLSRLDLSGVFCCMCPGLSAEGVRVPLRATRTVVDRKASFLELDEHCVLVVVARIIHVLLGLCPVCGSRLRLLPCDLLPRKLYSVDVIDELCGGYSKGDRSLRSVAWGISGDRTPAHTTLHAWTEGMGSYARGQPAGEVAEALPASAVLAEAESRHPEVAEVRRSSPEIPRVRYRSSARQERLAAGAIFLGVAAVFAATRHALSELNRLIVLWRPSFGFGFRTGLRNTPSEHFHLEDREHCGTEEEVPCPIPWKPPDSATNRSRHSSTNGCREPNDGTF